MADLRLMAADALGALARAGARAAAFPVQGKQPVPGVRWRGLPAGLHGTSRQWARASGYALAPVAGSRLAILDVDDPALLPDLLAAAPALGAPDAMQVMRSAHLHLYVVMARPLRGVRKVIGPDGHERASLRGAGAYIVGPGSLHPSGAVYRQFGAHPALLDDAQSGALLALFGPETPQSDTMPDGWLSGRLPGVFAQLEQAIEKRIGHPLRFSRSGTAPFRACWREDKHPSAFFSRQNGMVFDSATGQRWTLRELLQAFGLNAQTSAGADAPKTGKPETMFSRVSKVRNQPLHPRAALIHAGHTLTARLLDVMRDALLAGDVTRAEVLARFEGRAGADRALAQAVEAGMLHRPARGRYALTDAGRSYAQAAVPLPADAYAGAPVQYRRAVWREAVKAMRRDASERQPSTSAIARAAGVSRAAGYRYDRALDIQRVRVLARRPVRWFEPAMRYDVVRRDGVSIAQYRAGDAFEAWCSARAHAERARAWVWAVESWPSIRRLPGEALPASALLDAGGYVVINLPAPAPARAA